MMVRYGVAAAAGIVAVATAAWAVDVPQRKPGLWEVQMTHSASQRPPMTYKMCLDASTEKDLTAFGTSMAKQTCSQSDIHREGNVVTTDAVCTFGSTKSTSHSVATFSGDTAFHIDVTVHYDPPLFGKSDSAMAQDGHWVGACQPDQQPGDVIMPYGGKINLKNMTGGSP